MQSPLIKWPEDRNFAFTIFDDTDRTTVANGSEVYQLLQDLGMRTTKSVWPGPSVRPAEIGGSTCANKDYLSWVLQLQAAGFEIALHGVTNHSSTRREVEAGLNQFREYFGTYPRSHANHAGNEDNIYWGPQRLSGLERQLYTLAFRGPNKRRFLGEIANSAHFWADLCQQRIEYVRNFVFADMNTLKACPWMPYHDPTRPYVNQWFAASNGSDCDAFCQTIGERQQDQLEAEGGACIIYTHFGTPGFLEGRRLNRRFVALLSRLAAKGGWFVPVSTLLDEIRLQRGELELSRPQRKRLERRWLRSKLLAKFAPSQAN